MNWESIVEAIQRHSLAVRIKLTGDSDEPEWASWAIIPTNGYIEISTLGPIAFRDVEWIEIDASLISKNGRLSPRFDAEHTLVKIKTEGDLFEFDGNRARITVNSFN